MKHVLLSIIGSWVIVSAGSFIARGFSQGTTSEENKSDTTVPSTVKQLVELKRKNRTLDDSVAHYKEKDSTIIEERKEINKGNKVIGNKLKVAVQKANENLQATVIQSNRLPIMYVPIPKPREVLLIQQPTVKPLPDTFKVERNIWDKLLFRKKRRK